MGQRQGYDLFTKMGRKNFFRKGLLGDKWSRANALTDTLGHHICALLGHSEETYEHGYQGEGKRIVCCRCNRYIADRCIEEDAE